MPQMPTQNPSAVDAVALPRDISVTTGSLWVGIWRLSWPMLLMMICHFFVGFTDIYVAGLINPGVQAAIGFVSQLYFLFIILGNAISVGSVTLISRAMGAGDVRRALGHAGQSLIFGTAVSLILTIAVFVFHQGIVVAAGFPPDIRNVAEIFLKIFSLSLVPNYLLIISNAVFRASGEVKKPLFSMFIVSLINIVGDFGLVFGLFGLPQLGYQGIAVSTAIASFVGMGINLLLLSRGRWRAVYSAAWIISWQTLKRIAALGWPAALLQIAWNAGSIVLYNILGRLGDASVVAIASITNGLRIEAVIFLPAFALNMAASVLVGQNLGARATDRASKVGWEIALVGMVLVSAISLIVFIGAEYFASLLANDSAVLAETTRYLRINMLSEPFMALSLILGGGLQGAGDTRGTMSVIVIAMWCIRLPLAYLLAILLGWDALGVWIAMVTSMGVQSLLMAARFRRGRWKTINVE